MTDDPHPPSDRLVIVVHLPQDVAKIVALFTVLGEEWPDTVIQGNQVEIAADD